MKTSRKMANSFNPSFEKKLRFQKQPKCFYLVPFQGWFLLRGKEALGLDKITSTSPFQPQPFYDSGIFDTVLSGYKDWEYTKINSNNIHCYNREISKSVASWAWINSTISTSLISLLYIFLCVSFSVSMKIVKSSLRFTINQAWELRLYRPSRKTTTKPVNILIYCKGQFLPTPFYKLILRTKLIFNRKFSSSYLL